jgi:hypothetical protein
MVDMQVVWIGNVFFQEIKAGNEKKWTKMKRNEDKWKMKKQKNMRRNEKMKGMKKNEGTWNKQIKKHKKQKKTKWTRKHVEMWVTNMISGNHILKHQLHSGDRVETLGTKINNGQQSRLLTCNTTIWIWMEQNRQGVKKNGQKKTQNMLSFFIFFWSFLFFLFICLCFFFFLFFLTFFFWVSRQ